MAYISIRYMHCKMHAWPNIIGIYLQFLFSCTYACSYLHKNVYQMDLFRKDLFFFLAHLSLTLNSKKPLYSYCSCYCIVIIFVLTCRYIVLYKWIYILRFSPPIRSKCTYFLYSYVVLHTRTYILRAYMYLQMRAWGICIRYSNS